MQRRRVAVVGDELIDITLPLRTKNPTNNRQHWRVVWKRSKKERGTAYMLTKQKIIGMTFPVVVTLTRLSAGELDDDNLRSSLKAIRDGVADAFGMADNDKRLKFDYAQEKCKRGAYGVRIQIDAVSNP